MKKYPSEYNIGRFRLKYCKHVYYMLFNLIPIYLFDIYENSPEKVILKFNDISNNGMSVDYS